jgi:formate dehydrogenase maturation protein FdhE
MFEDETVDIACPNCGHRNSILVREFEESAETHFVCQSCKAGVKIEANEFRHRLEQVREELESLERDAARESKRKAKRPRKGDFQI